MNGIHQLLIPGKIVYGRGSFAQTGEVAASFGRRALIVSDPLMEKLGHVAQCESLLREKGLASFVYAGVDAETTDVHVREALAQCRAASCDVIVALGGGSCIDAAKAVAALMTNGDDITEYAAGRKRFVQPPLPLVAIPTTAGTGSEMTRVAVVIDTANEVKWMVAQPELLPAAAIVDPLLTLTCPPAVTAATGIDALCHAMEAYLSRRKQPVTDMYALTAIRLLLTYLPRAYADGQDVEAREQVSLASMLAGTAFSNASVTLVHGMSRPIGALFHVPHGLSNAMLLPVVLEYTKDAAIRLYAEMLEAIKPEAGGLPLEARGEMLISIVRSLCRDLQIPNMRQWGIERERLAQVVDKMATDALASGSPGHNPKVPTHDEIVQLYFECFDDHAEGSEK